MRVVYSTRNLPNINQKNLPRERGRHRQVIIQSRTPAKQASDVKMALLWGKMEFGNSVKQVQA